MDLYRMFDADRTLLYVGISLNAAARASQHSKDKPWWDDVATIEVEQWDVDRPEIERIEREAIRNEHPLHNVQHNNGSSPHHFCGTPALLERRGRTRPYDNTHSVLPVRAGDVVALSLADRCPVGLVSRIWLPDGAYPTTDVELDLYRWGIGVFDGPTLMVPWREVREWRRASLLRVVAGERVYDMDPLAEMQLAWEAC